MGFSARCNQSGSSLIPLSEAKSSVVIHHKTSISVKSVYIYRNILFHNIRGIIETHESWNRFITSSLLAGIKAPSGAGFLLLK